MTLKELWIHTEFQIRNHWKLWVAIAVAVTVGLTVALFPPALVFLLSIAPILSSSFFPAAVHAACAAFLVCGAFNAICYVQRKLVGNNPSMFVQGAFMGAGIAGGILMALGSTGITAVIAIVNAAAFITNKIDSKICPENLRENYQSELDIYRGPKEPESNITPSPAPKARIVSSFCQSLRRMNCCRSDSAVPDMEPDIDRIKQAQAQAFLSALKPRCRNKILDNVPNNDSVASPAV